MLSVSDFEIFPLRYTPPGLLSTVAQRNRTCLHYVLLRMMMLLLLLLLHLIGRRLYLDHGAAAEAVGSGGGGGRCGGGVDADAAVAGGEALAAATCHTPLIRTQTALKFGRDCFLY